MRPFRQGAPLVSQVECHGEKVRAGICRWNETVPERIRLAATQRPTIPLRVNTSERHRCYRRLITMDALKSYTALLCVALLAVPTGGFAGEQQTGAAERQTGPAERQTPR